ncbi:hypothetical protein SpCBS45565_g07816 [Spizellomyces sp. 'palustris']|nr:hypothetical protein SpCBS45565_g07816 [Spizellomyces sp. 'palustris']
MSRRGFARFDNGGGRGRAARHSSSEARNRRRSGRRRQRGGSKLDVNELESNGGISTTQELEYGDSGILGEDDLDQQDLGPFESQALSQRNVARDYLSQPRDFDIAQEGQDSHPIYTRETTGEHGGFRGRRRGGRERTPYVDMSGADSTTERSEQQSVHDDTVSNRRGSSQRSGSQHSFTSPLSLEEIKRRKRQLSSGADIAKEAVETTGTITEHPQKDIVVSGLDSPSQIVSHDTLSATGVLPSLSEASETESEGDHPPRRSTRLASRNKSAGGLGSDAYSEKSRRNERVVVKTEETAHYTRASDAKSLREERTRPSEIATTATAEQNSKRHGMMFSPTSVRNSHNGTGTNQNEESGKDTAAMTSEAHSKVDNAAERRKWTPHTFPARAGIVPHQPEGQSTSELYAEEAKPGPRDNRENSGDSITNEEKEHHRVDQRMRVEESDHESNNLIADQRNMDQQQRHFDLANSCAGGLVAASYEEDTTSDVGSRSQAPTGSGMEVLQATQSDHANHRISTASSERDLGSSEPYLPPPYPSMPSKPISLPGVMLMSGLVGRRRLSDIAVPVDSLPKNSHEIPTSQARSDILRTTFEDGNSRTQHPLIALPDRSVEVRKSNEWTPKDEHIASISSNRDFERPSHGSVRRGRNEDDMSGNVDHRQSISPVRSSDVYREQRQRYDSYRPAYRNPSPVGMGSTVPLHETRPDESSRTPMVSDRAVGRQRFEALPTIPSGRSGSPKADDRSSWRHHKNETRRTPLPSRPANSIGASDCNSPGIATGRKRELSHQTADEELSVKRPRNDVSAPSSSTLATADRRAGLEKQINCLLIGMRPLGEVLILVEDMVDSNFIPSMEVMRAILRAAVSRRDIEALRQGFKVLQDIYHTKVIVDDYLLVAEGYALFGDATKLRAVITQARRSGVELESGHYSLLWRVLPPSSNPDVTRVLGEELLASTGRIDAGLGDQILREMMAARLTSEIFGMFKILAGQDVEFDRRTLNELISYYVEVNEHEYAFHIFEYMFARHIPVDVQMLFSLCLECCKRNRLTGLAVKIYDAAKEHVGLRIRDAGTLEAIIEAFDTRGKTAEALTALEDLAALNVTMRSDKVLRSLLRSCAENRLLERFVVPVKKLIQPSKALITLDGHSGVIEEIMEVCLDLAHTSDAFWFYRYMKSNSVPGWTRIIDKLLSALARDTTLSEEGFDIVMDALLSRVPVSIRIAVAVLKSLGARKQWKNAEELISQWEGMGMEWPSAVSGDIFQIMTMVNRHHEAVRYYEKLRLEGSALSSLGEPVLKAFLHHTFAESEFQVSEQMISQLRAENMPVGREFVHQMIQDLESVEDPAAVALAVCIFCWGAERGSAHHVSERELKNGYIHAEDCWSLLESKLSILRHLEYLGSIVEGTSASSLQGRELPWSKSFRIKCAAYTSTGPQRVTHRDVAKDVAAWCEESLVPPLRVSRANKSDGRGHTFVEIDGRDMRNWLDQVFAGGGSRNPLDCLVEIKDKTLENGTLIPERRREEVKAPRSERDETPMVRIPDEEPSRRDVTEEEPRGSPSPPALPHPSPRTKGAIPHDLPGCDDYVEGPRRDENWAVPPHPSPPHPIHTGDEHSVFQSTLAISAGEDLIILEMGNIGVTVLMEIDLKIRGQEGDGGLHFFPRTVEVMVDQEIGREDIGSWLRT